MLSAVLLGATAKKTEIFYKFYSSLSANPRLSHYYYKCTIERESEEWRLKLTSRV